jgi:hypothetical protein
MCKLIMTDDEVETALADYIKKVRGNSKVSIREVVWREVTANVRCLQINYDLPEAIDAPFSEVYKQVCAA